MIRLFTTTILTLGFIVTGVSQDADGLLLRLSEKAKTYKTIDATYSSKMVDLKNNFEEEMKGHILIEDRKFNLDMGDFLIRESRSYPIPVIPPYYVRTLHIRGVWTTNDINQ